MLLSASKALIVLLKQSRCSATNHLTEQTYTSTTTRSKKSGRLNLRRSTIRVISRHSKSKTTLRATAWSYSRTLKLWMFSNKLCTLWWDKEDKEEAALIEAPIIECQEWTEEDQTSAHHRCPCQDRHHLRDHRWWWIQVCLHRQDNKWCQASKCQDSQCQANKCLQALWHQACQCNHLKLWCHHLLCKWVLLWSIINEARPSCLHARKIILTISVK